MAAQSDIMGRKQQKSGWSGSTTRQLHGMRSCGNRRHGVRPKKKLSPEHLAKLGCYRHPLFREMSSYLAPKQANPWSALLKNDADGDPIMPPHLALDILDELKRFHEPGGAPVVLYNEAVLRSDGGKWSCSHLYWDAESPLEAYPGVYDSSTGIFEFTGEYKGTTTKLEPSIASLLLTNLERVD